jgi:ankyrin repeat protein
MKGYAPIHLACDRGHLEVVRLLLSRGANRDIKVIQKPTVSALKVLKTRQDPDNLTPLELSQEAGHTEIATLLKLHS